VGWLLPLWWLAVRRRWRQESGAALATLFTVVAAGALTANAPAEGVEVYHSVVLLILLLGVVFAPLLLSAENVVSSNRLLLVPVAPRLLRAARVLLGNSLRTLLAV